MRSDPGGWFGLALIVGIVIFIAAILCCGAAYADDNQPRGGGFANSPPVESPRPSFCQPGWVCMRTKDAADLLIKVELLEEQVSVLKAKRLSKFGYAAVCGPAASLSATDGNTTLAGTLSCVIGVGYRF